MACKNLNWDWKSGETREEKINGYDFPINYFFCGTYYSDGIFNLVKFPKGMKIYHGSGALANAGVEFPVGIQYYSPHKIGEFSVIPSNFTQIVASSNEKIEYLLSKYFPISAGWFADPFIAQIYSNKGQYAPICKNKCINSYVLNQDIDFFLLDNEYNIFKLIKSYNVPDDIKTALSIMFNLNQTPQLDPNKIRKLNLIKKRESYYEIDKPFAEWFCNTFKNNYAGYAADTQIKDYKPIFHHEFIFCNAFKYLNRDLTNIFDWQHQVPIPNAVIKNFITQLKLYKTTNVDFHAGNLLEHSIWSLLFAEDLLFNLKDNFISSMSTINKKIISGIAFIHDIGKMTPDNNNMHKRKSDMIYFAIPEHPQIGGDYIRKTKQLPFLDQDLNQLGFFNTDDLLLALGMDLNFRDSIAKIIDLHWEFGNFLRIYNENKNESLINSFIETVGNENLFFYHALIIISIADIMASQPYGMNDLNDKLNRESIFFPFIKNMPKNYRGGNIAEKSNLLTTGLEFATKIIEKIKKI